MQLDVDQRVLYQDREVIPLPPKAMDILIVLLEDAGQVVTRETIRQRVWESTFVEEANITKNIGLLRSTLRVYLDDADPIKTITKRGYQFVGPVDQTQQIPVPIPERGPEQAQSSDQILQQPGQREEESAPEVVAAPPAKTEMTHPGRVVRGTSLLRRPVLGWMVGACLLLAACTGFAVDRWRTGQEATATRASLAILTIRNLSDSRSDDWLGAALAETLGSDLTNGNGVRLVSGSRVAEAERDLTIAEARSYDDTTMASVGRRLGCDLALTGSYLPEGDLIRIDLQLRRTSNGAVVETFSRITDRHELIAAVGQASANLRQAIGLVPSTPVAGYLGSIDNKAQDGVRDYVEGQRLLKAGRFNEARPLLSEAVAIKSDFPLAHSALASTWMAMGYADKATEEAKQALAGASSLPPEKQLILEANAYAIFVDWPKAIAAYTKLTKMYPDDLDYPASLAECLYRSGDPKQALALLRSLVASSKVAANDPRFAMLESSSAGAMADWRGQLLYAGEAIRLARASSSPYFESKGLWMEGIAWARVGDREHGLRDFRQAQEICTRLGDELGLANVLTSLGAEQGYRKEPEAADTLRKALALFEKLGNRGAEVMALSELGCALTYTEDWEGAKASFHAAIDRATDLHNPALGFGAVLDLAYVASNQDDLNAESQYAHEALEISRAAGNLDGVASSREYLGNIAYQKGDLKNARAEYEQASEVLKQVNSGYAIAKLMNHFTKLDMAEGDLAGARRLQTQVVSMHVLMGERLDQQMLTESELKIEEGHPEEVIAPMTAMGEKATTADPGAEAWRLVAKAYLLRGDVGNARMAIEKALVLARRSEDTTDYLIPDLLLSAQIAAAEGHGATAAVEMSDLQRRAERIRNERLQLEVRLAAGALAVARGQRVEGERTLQAVATEASQHGFGLTAEKARKALPQA